MTIKDQARVVLRVYGDVQRVGYRFVVQDLARKMGVKGYVKNLPDGSVEIVAEASREIIDKFVDAVKIKDPPIDVFKLDAVYPEATGEYEYFSLIYGDLTEELVEGFGAGLNYVNLSRVETKQGFQGLEGSTREMDVSVKTMHGDMNMHFEEMAERYDVISSELIRTREELTRAVDSMSKLIDEFIKARRKRGD